MNYVNIKRTGTFHTFLLYVSKSIGLVNFCFFLSLSSVTLLGDALEFPFLNVVRKSILDTIYPGLEILSYPSHYTNNLIQEISEYIEAKAENKILKEAYKQKALSEDYAKQLLMENKKLKDLLGFVSNSRIDDYISTNLIAFNNDKNFSHNAMIPLGEKDGIKRNQAVVNEEGLVGKVVDVGKNFSQIMLITDINFRASIITAESGKKAIISGNNTNELDIGYSFGEEDFKIGEQVITLGDYPCFAGGLKVGKIDKNRKIIPNINWNTLYHVTIIK